MAEFHAATKELQNLTREMGRMTRARDFAGFDAQRERSGAARTRVAVAMLAVVRGADRDGRSEEVASETSVSRFVGSTS